jgi:hypothetical protein
MSWMRLKGDTDTACALLVCIDTVGVKSTVAFGGCAAALFKCGGLTLPPRDCALDMLSTPVRIDVCAA